VSSPSQERVEMLLGSYVPRFREDFYASLPAPAEATE